VPSVEQSWRLSRTHLAGQSSRHIIQPHGHQRLLHSDASSTIKGVSVRTLDRWIHAGKIGFTTLHRSILIHKADFDKFTPQVVYGKSRKRRNKVGG